MILFAVKKTHDENNGYEISEAENFIIPVTYDTNEKINENNIQLISWNLAIYKPTPFFLARFFPKLQTT